MYHPFYVQEISQSGSHVFQTLRFSGVIFFLKFFVIVTLLLSLGEQGSRQFPFNV